MRASDKKLAAALHEAELHEMAKRAESGEFNEFFGPYACGITRVAEELAAIGSMDALKLRARVIKGEFDAGAEESEEWAASAEGQDAFRQLVRR